MSTLVHKSYVYVVFPSACQDCNATAAEVEALQEDLLEHEETYYIFSRVTALMVLVLEIIQCLLSPLAQC